MVATRVVTIVSGASAGQRPLRKVSPVPLRYLAALRAVSHASLWRRPSKRLTVEERANLAAARIPQAVYTASLGGHVHP